MADYCHVFIFSHGLLQQTIL